MTEHHVETDRLNQRFYDPLEGFACEPGCTTCCQGIVSLSIPELLRLETHLTELSPRREIPKSGCPFRSEAGCLIYPVRPFMCRLFGSRYLHADLHTQPGCPRRQVVCPGEIEGPLFLAYQRFCGENGFVLLGQSRDPGKNNGPLADNRRAVRVFPFLHRFSHFLTGGDRCFEPES